MFNWFKAKQQESKSLGQIGEELAQKEYKKNGYSIVAANFYNKKGLRRGEIDFIASGKDCIIFVEVKTRTRNSGKFGSGAEAVNRAKQKKLLQAVQIFFQKYPKYRSFRPQIDVCVVEFSEEVDNSAVSVKIIPNAVEDRN